MKARATRPGAATPALTPLIFLTEDASIPLGGTTGITYTIENPNAGSTGIALTGISFTDTLPGGLQFQLGTFGDTCGQGQQTFTQRTLSISGTSLAANSECQISVNATGTAAGAQQNQVTVTSDQGTGNTAAGTVEVVAPLTFTASFGATWITPGSSDRLTFAIGNANGTSRTAIAFSDSLPAGLTITSPSHLTGSCGGGTIKAAAGSAGISLTGATLKFSQNCSFSVTVTGTSIGARQNTAGPISSKEGGQGSTATATVSVARKTVRGGAGIDAATGRAYYGDNSPAAIPYTRLDGTGAGVLAHPGVSSTAADGVAIDPAVGKIYWSDLYANTISWASLNGSGGGILNTTGAAVKKPVGVAIDPSNGRIYWANSGSGTIAYASLDGSGHGGYIDTSAVSVYQPEGVAIDVAAGRIYWADEVANAIGWADLNGDGNAGYLTTTVAAVQGPVGLAIDHAAGQIYWANFTGGSISYAALDGSGGGGVNLSGGTTTGSVLRCGTGSWAADQLGAFLYQSPQSFSYRWSRNGTVIAGAAKSSLTAGLARSYRCTVTASNGAGSASQQSNAHTVR